MRHAPHLKVMDTIKGVGPFNSGNARHEIRKVHENVRLDASNHILMNSGTFGKNCSSSRLMI